MRYAKLLLRAFRASAINYAGHCIILYQAYNDFMDKIMSLNDWLPYDAKLELAKAAKNARLNIGWKRDTLSEKTGIPNSTLKRYETTGEISLDQFLKLVFVLGDLDKLKGIFDSETTVFATLDDMLNVNPRPKRKRGRL